ncbi:MAG: hypothetical protein A3G76_13910 [Acidobacteria bacterium RIFCSPLOWO2_12_FULL_65_11]|nr:MAG: hypothetical protein A3H95_08070 [Acidobacteria bacterium RIFCSPLOWO2_02_FULL_64_15]OFW32570.1 MAG: hypothetical protein A3G76_13910 [Acidobacteria bacterium RIFCSPLOWO2_12_FULL_65_11]
MPADFSVVAIVAAYNEADIIEHVVSDLIDQGIHVYFLDDGSTDRTVAIVEPYVGRGVLAIERITGSAADGGPTGFEWERILLRKTQLARELDADWFIHHDADEFRESPWSHLSLKDAIRRVDALGWNAIDFAGLDFWPVHDRFQAGDDVRDAFAFYVEAAAYDRVQIRCWKKTADLDLVSSGGHDARFHGRKVFPVRFILRHYPIRGQAHGERKIFHERRDRFLERERARGWHVQYDDLREGASFIRDPATLTRYDPDALRIALTLRHRGVEQLESSVDELRSVAEAGRRELARNQEELARTRAEVDRRTAELVQASAENTRLGRASDEQAAEIARWRSTVEDLTRRLDAFERSLSWRWTRPARAVYRMLKRWFHNL